MLVSPAFFLINMQYQFLLSLFNDLCVTSWNFYFFQGRESSCFAHAGHLYHFIACFASFTSAENRQLYCLFAGYILVMLIKNCHSNKRIIDTFIWQHWCLVNCKLRENDGLRNWITYKEHLVFCFLWNEEVHNLADWCFFFITFLSQQRRKEELSSYAIWSAQCLHNIKCSMLHLNFLCNIGAQCSIPTKHFQFFPCLMLYVSSCTCAFWHQISCIKDNSKANSHNESWHID